MIFNIKKTLLAGTALVAVGAFSAPAQAAVVAQTLTGSVEWATDANQNQSPADGTGAAANDTVNLATFTLTVTDDGANNDGTAGAGFVLGAVTGTTGDLLITDAAAGDGDLDVTVASFNTSSTGDFTVTALDAEDGDITVDVTGALTTGGALVVTNTETTDVNDVLTLNVGGALTVTGTTTFTGAADPASTSAITVTGNSAFTGAVTVTGGAGAGSTATLTLNGATNTATAGIALTDGAAGNTAILKFAGSSAQTFTGAVTGDGNVVVDNASGVTFNSAVTADTIVIEKATGNSAATFKAAVTAPITLGGAGTGTNTVTFNGTTAGFTVTGAIAGAAAGETNNIVVLGGNTIVQATASTANLDNLTVSGSSTILDSNAALTVTNTTIGSGAKIDVGSGLFTSTIANSGTLLLSGTGGVAGNITGTGTLDVNANASVTGNVSQGSATVAEGSTLTVVGAASRTVTTNILLEDATSNGTDAGLTFDNGANTTTYTGDITVGVNGEGLITFANDNGATLAIVGDIGTSSKKIGNLTFENAGGNAQTLTTTGDLYVNAIALDASDTLQFLGTSAQTVSGTIAGHGAGEGILTVGNGTTASNVTFDGIIGGTTLASGSTAANATAIYNANATFAGTYTTTGTTQVNAGKTMTVGTTAGSGTYNFGVSKASGTQTFGKVVETGNTDLSTNTIHFVVDTSQPLTTGASVMSALFDDDDTDAVIAGATVTDNSFIYSFTLVNDTANDEVDVTVAVDNSIAETSSTQANESVGTVLITDLAASTNAEINDIQNALVTAGTQDAVNEVLEAAGPSVDGSALVGGFQASSQSIDLTSERLAAVRGGETGVASGNMGNGVTAWIQGFGKLGQQDKRDGIDGYDADTLGVAVGTDTENMADDTLVGLSLSYANTDVESENATTTDTDIDSYQLTLYGDYDIDQLTYVSGSLGYAWNNIDQVRHNVGGVSGLTAAADYNSNQWFANAEVGRDYAVGTATVTPSVGLNYQHISIDGYTEEGAGGANLSVDNEDLNVLEVGVGAEAKWSLKQADGSEVVPALHAGVRHDLIGDNVETTSTFTGGGPSFTSQGADPAQTTFDVGGSVALYTVNNWALTGSYDYEAKTDYDAHSGYVRAGYKF